MRRKQLVHKYYVDSESMVMSFKQNYTLSSHHQMSYEFLIAEDLPTILGEVPIQDMVHIGRGVKHSIQYKAIRIRRPQRLEDTGDYRKISSTETHCRKMSFMADVQVDVIHKLYHAKPNSTTEYVLKENRLFLDLKMFELPVMDGTSASYSLDELDPITLDRYRGTFVLNSYRKILLTQAGLRGNFPFVFPMPRDQKYRFRCEIRSIHPTKIRSTSTLYFYLTRVKQGVIPSVVVKIPFIPIFPPLTVVFRLLGVATLQDMVEMVAGRRADPEFRALVSSMIWSCPGRNDPTCHSDKASREDLLVWLAVACNGATATGSSNTLNMRDNQSHISSMSALLTNEVLPHLDNSPNTELVECSKALFLAMAVRKMLQVARGKMVADDIDDARHKRFTTPGRVLAIKLRQEVRTFNRKLHSDIMRMVETHMYVHVPDLFAANSSAISTQLRNCMSSGNFSVGQSKTSTQAGVSQVQNSMNLLSRLGHFTCLNAPLCRNGKLSRPREMQASHWRVYCAADTPEGQSVGLLNHHTTLSTISMGYQEKLLAQVVLSIDGVRPITADWLRGGDAVETIVVINGCFSCCTSDPEHLVCSVVQMRRTMVIPTNVGVVYDRALGQVVIHAENGQATAPVVCLEAAGGRLLPKLFEVVEMYRKTPEHLFPELICEGILSWMNKDEELTAVIATTFKDVLNAPSETTYTHMEIDPSLSLLGIVASVVPRMNQNQGPRDIYACSMLKQASGAQHPTFKRFQLDVRSHTLCYPQKCLVDTLGQRLCGLDKEPITQQVTIVILPSDGLNQEDAIAITQSALDLGLFRSEHSLVLRDKENRHGPTDTEKFGIPPGGAEGMKQAAKYHAIDPLDGLPMTGALLRPRDVVVAKYMTYTVTSTTPVGTTEIREVVTDRSQVYRGTQPARVERVELTSERGSRSVCVRLQVVSTATASDLIGGITINVGDKFSSLCSQKGVAARIVPKEDQPFTTEGISADIVVNVHGVASRMTLGQVIEMLAGKYAAMDGNIFDGTPFRKVSAPALIELLRSVKHSTMSMMTCGVSGKQIGLAFVGIASYQLLKHYSANKVHARSSGPRQSLTSQPVEGRSRDGGLRVGAMELSAMTSTGASAVCRDRMLLSSDAVEAYMCECGQVASAPEPQDMATLRLHLDGPKKAFCCKCRLPDGQKIHKILIPAPTLLLKRSLAGASIRMDLPIQDPSLGKGDAFSKLLRR